MARNFSSGTLNLGTAVTALQITGDITVAGWIKAPAISASSHFKHLFGCYNPSSPNTGWGVSLTHSIGVNGSLGYWSNGNGAWRSSSSRFDDDVWRHFAIVISGTGAGAGTFYRDLVSDGTFSHTAPGAFTGTMRIGARSDAVALSNLVGALAHLCVWDAALSVNELRFHSNGRVPRWASLKGWWRIVGYSPEPDWSGQGNHGTVSGTTVVDDAPIAPPFGFDFGWSGGGVALAGAGAVAHLLNARTRGVLNLGLN